MPGLTRLARRVHQQPRAHARLPIFIGAGALAPRGTLGQRGARDRRGERERGEGEEEREWQRLRVRMRRRIGATGRRLAQQLLRRRPRSGRTQPAARRALAGARCGRVAGAASNLRASVTPVTLPARGSDR